MSVNNLRVCHINANSLRGHIEQIRLFLASEALIHVLAVTESWLGPSVEDTLVSLDEYILFRRDRNTRGGGVALYVHKSLSVNHICSSSAVWTGRPGFPEYLFCEVIPKGGDPIFVGVVYRPPHAPFIQGTDFVSTLRDTMQGYGTKVILGDFNSDLLSDNADAAFLKSFMDENSLFSVPFGATHHTSSSDTWLDLCIVDALDTVTSYSKSVSPFIAGHDWITATLDIYVPQTATCYFSYRDFKSVDPMALNEYLSKCDWSVATNDRATLSDRLDCLYTNLRAALDITAPIKTFRHGKKNYHPWFTPFLRFLITERDRLYRRYKRSKLEV